MYGVYLSSSLGACSYLFIDLLFPSAAQHCVADDQTPGTAISFGASDGNEVMLLDGSDAVAYMAYLAAPILVGSQGTTLSFLESSPDICTLLSR